MKNVPLRPSNYASMHPFCITYCNLKFANSIWKNVYFWFIALFRKLYLASSALSHGSEVTSPVFCIASALILCKNAGRTWYFKSESSCNTCFGSPKCKQINTISVPFRAVQAVTISSSFNRRLQIACFLSLIGNCMQSID